jgi:hypothetical protein
MSRLQRIGFWVNLKPILCVVSAPTNHSIIRPITVHMTHMTYMHIYDTGHDNRQLTFCHLNTEHTNLELLLRPELLLFCIMSDILHNLQ